MTVSFATKQRLTRDALAVFVRSVPAPRYDVRAIYSDGRAGVMREYNVRTLLDPDTIRFLRAKNAEGGNIFIRPCSFAYVLVDLDDDGATGLQWMIEDGVAVAFAVETSPGHMQAWVRLGDVRYVTEDEHREAARLLAQSHGGDMGSAHVNQLGRAPGFFNRKPQYRDAVGHYPLVKRKAVQRTLTVYPLLDEVRQRLEAKPPSPARRAPGAPTTTAGDTADRPVPDDETAYKGAVELRDGHGHVFRFSPLPDYRNPATAFAEAIADMKADGHKFVCKSDGAVDRSRQDFEVARHLLCCECGLEFVVEALMHGSEKAKERGRKYACRTVSSATPV